jgi:16S rRNA (cytosine967-C5)-methyltransferase
MQRHSGQRRERGANLAERFSRRKGPAGEFLDAVRHDAPPRMGPTGVPTEVLGLSLPSALPTGPAGQHALSLLSRVEELAPQAGYYAAMAEAARLLRGARSLHSRQRRFVGDALHGAVRMLRRLRRLASLSATAPLRRVSATQLYLVWLAEQSTPPGAPLPPPLPSLLAAQGIDPVALDAARQQLAQNLLRSAQDTREKPADSARLDALVDAAGDALSYPGWLVRCFLAAFAGDEAGLDRALAILSAQNERAPLCVRVNRLRGGREEAIPRLLAEHLQPHPTPLASDGLYLDGHENIYATATFAEGWIELQDEGSQLIAELVSPPPGGVVVDACAGAGGKTLALGALLQNRGRLLAIDIDRRKIEELSRRTRRAGLTNVQALVVPEHWTGDGGATLLPGWLQNTGADRVLVDAPCSGLGVLRRNPEARWRLQGSDLDELCSKQARLLQGAAALVRPHGRLIYSTCTILPRENEEIVEAFLRRNPAFSIVPVKEIFGSARAVGCSDASGTYLRTYPSPSGPDGFFAAVLRRSS